MNAADLATRLDETITAHDHASALRKGDLSHPERWPLRRRDEIDAYRSELDAIGAAADDLLATDPTGTERTLAEAVRYGARATAVRLDLSVELMSITPSIGTVSSMLTFLPRHALADADQGDRFLTRVAAFEPFVDEWCDRLVEAAADGVVPIRHLVEQHIALIDRNLPKLHEVIGAQPAPTDLDDAAADAWRAELAQRIDTHMAPALERLRATLAEHTLPAARPDDRPGLVHLDGGADTYRRLLWSHTSTDLTPEQVHQIGLDQIDRLEREYVDVAGPLFGLTDVADIYARLRDDPELRYADADQIVADATAALDKALAAAPSWFHRLPEAGCTANPIEQGALAFYAPPSPDGQRGGQFFFQTGDPSMWSTYQLEAVTYHESIPGHHLQLALTRELDEVHPLLEEYLVPAYCEGWGLYTERLADEMGLYSSELDRVGMLAADSMRACRLVVDTGLHALGWSRDQAIAYMVDHSPMSATLVAGEIDRYIGMPGQACSYMIGRLAIDDARAAAERTLGERFDIRDFHDVVLTTGAIPLDSLTRVVAEWAAA